MPVMTDTVPTSKIKRTLSTGKIAVKMGTRQLEFMIKKPFLSKETQQISREKKTVKMPGPCLTASLCCGARR